MQFSAQFQDRVAYNSPLEVVWMHELKLAAEASCTAQEPVKPARVKALVAAILKDGQLWQPPKLVHILDTQETIAFGGRHRTEAIDIICRDYVVAPTGAVVPRSSATADCEEIEPTVAVIRVTVRTRAEAASLLTSDNSSRSMTTAEKLYTEEFANTLSALAKLKLGMTRHISGTHVYHSSGESLEITSQTIKTMVTALIKALGQKKALAMTEQQVDALCTEFSDFLEDEDNSRSWDTNFSRDGHKQAIADFLEMPALDEDGDILTVEVEDEDGDVTEEEVTWLQNFAASVVIAKAPKKSKETKASEAQRLIEELQAELAALKAGMQ